MRFSRSGRFADQVHPAERDLFPMPIGARNLRPDLTRTRTSTRHCRGRRNLPLGTTRAMLSAPKKGSGRRRLADPALQAPGIEWQLSETII
jgi:hypothetical protein